MKLKDICETFENDLQDPEFVQVYLEEALSDGGSQLPDGFTECGSSQ